MERRAELVLCEAAKVGGRAFATARTLSAQRGRLNVLFVANLCRIHGDRARDEGADGSNEHVADLSDRPANGGMNRSMPQVPYNSAVSGATEVLDSQDSRRFPIGCQLSYLWTRYE